MRKENTHGPVLLRNTMAYDRQHAEEFRHAVRQAVDFDREHAPQRMVQVYIDEAKGLCYSLQLFPDSEAILRHWQVSDPNIAEVRKYCEIRSMEVYGNPSEEVRNGILGSLGEAGVSYTPELVGFYHS